MRHAGQKRERQRQEGGVPECRGNHRTFWNSPFHPTVAERAGVQKTVCDRGAEQRSDAAQRALVKVAPGDRQVRLQLTVGQTVWRGRRDIAGRRRRRRLPQKVDRILDAVEFHEGSSIPRPNETPRSADKPQDHATALGRWGSGISAARRRRGFPRLQWLATRRSSMRHRLVVRLVFAAISQSAEGAQVFGDAPR